MNPIRLSHQHHHHRHHQAPRKAEPSDTLTLGHCVCCLHALWCEHHQPARHFAPTCDGGGGGASALDLRILLHLCQPGVSHCTCWLGRVWTCSWIKPLETVFGNTTSWGNSRHYHHQDMMIRSVISTTTSEQMKLLTPLELNFLPDMELVPESSFNTSYSPRRVQAAESIESDVCSKPFYFDMFRLMSILSNQNLQTSNLDTSTTTTSSSPPLRKSKPLKVSSLSR